MSAPVRLPQVVLVTADLPSTVEALQSQLGLDADPYSDPGVAEFGLENRVIAAGDCFLEVLTPVVPGTAGGRHLERHGGDGGYMAIFQLADRDTPRRRVAELGLRVAWSIDFDDISATHLHPADVPGAIVSLDWADPPESWRWAGPAWTGGAPGPPESRAGGVRGITVAAVNPIRLAARWAEVLALDLGEDGSTVELREAGQQLRFVPAPDSGSQGIVGCELDLPHGRGSGRSGGAARNGPVMIGGVRFTVRSA